MFPHTDFFILLRRSRKGEEKTQKGSTVDGSYCGDRSWLRRSIYCIGHWFDDLL